MKKKIGLAVVFFLLISTVVAGFGYYKYKNMVKEWYQPLEPSRQEEPPAGSQATPQNREEEDRVVVKPFYMMILGVDSRGEARSRSDTMMLAAVNPEMKKVALLSIPRDTLAYIPGHGRDKFNHSMFYGGPALVKETMERFFDIQIDHYASIDFAGFVKLVDELGGIEVQVKRRMKYDDPTDGTHIDLKPGLQHLNGKQALDYARFRKSDIGSDASDFERMERQQEVVRKLAEKAVSVTSAFRMFNLMNILGDHVNTDFTEPEIRYLALSFKGFSAAAVQRLELKGTNQRMPMHGYNLWVYIVDEEEKKRMRSALTEVLAGRVQTAAESEKRR